MSDPLHHARWRAPLWPLLRQEERLHDARKTDHRAFAMGKDVDLRRPVAILRVLHHPSDSPCERAVKSREDRVPVELEVRGQLDTPHVLLEQRSQIEVKEARLGGDHREVFQHADALGNFLDHTRSARKVAVPQRLNRHVIPVGSFRASRRRVRPRAAFIHRVAAPGQITRKVRPVDLGNSDRGNVVVRASRNPV